MHTISPSVRGVLFDAVGTLLYADPPAPAVYAAAAAEFGLRLDEVTVERRFLDAFRQHHGASQDCETGEGSRTTSQSRELERWRAIVAAVFPELPSTEMVFAKLWDHFALRASWRLYDDVAACWRRLSARGLLLGIASNFDDRLLAVCRGLPPLAACRHVFVSSQIGFRKPDPRFFRSIERLLDLTPRELCLVGDDWESDCLAAASAGWQAVCLDRIGKPLPVAASVRSLAAVH
jgi:putative hydrolase of the HAD superfamily